MNAFVNLLSRTIYYSNNYNKNILTDGWLQISNWRVPSISSKDRVLHSVFLLSILVMIVCSIATILSFKQADTLPKVSFLYFIDNVHNMFLSRLGRTLNSPPVSF